MTKVIRIRHFIIGLCMVLLGAVMVLDADESYPLVIFILGITMILAGIRLLVFYFSMARHMVGGMVMLYRGVIILDIGLFTMSMTDSSLFFVVMYLAGIHGFYGAIDILRAREARKLAGSWKLSTSRGVINIMICTLCLVFIGNVEVAVLVYAAGLIYSGIVHFAQAFRRKDTLYGDIAYDDRPAV